MRTLSSQDSNLFGHALLVDRLRRRLARLPYYALALLVQRILRQLGYKDVSILGRRYERGRTRQGGSDIRALTETPVGSTALLVQIKRHRTPVARHCVDELRGTILRESIPEGLLVTPSTFSPQAIKAAEAFEGRPVRLLDGAMLARWMIEFGYGVHQTRNLLTGDQEVAIDEEALHFLERYADSVTRERRGF